MKVVIAVNTSWNIFNFRLGLIKALQLSGHEVFAVAPKDEYVSKLEAIGVKHYHIAIDQKGTNPILDLKIVKDYRRIFKKIKPDIILSYTIKPNVYGNLAAWSLNISVINNISGLGTLFIKKTIFSVVAKGLYKQALNYSSWTFFQNNDDKQLFTDAQLIPSKKSTVIPGSGVNTSNFKYNRNSNKGNRFLFVGRLIGDKGIYEYLKAAEITLNKYLDVEFLIVGELGYNNNTAITEEKLNGWLEHPNIKFLGKHDDMIKVYKDVDVMVLPSYREGLSKSLIEAASMNLPIITTDVPGCRDVVEHGVNGLLCKVKSSKDLQLKMAHMIELSEKERLQMGENGRKLAVSKFDEKLIISIYENKINELLGCLPSQPKA